MTVLTLSVDDEVLRRAEALARERGTSVERLLEEYLAAVAIAEPSSRESAWRRFVHLAASAKSASGPEGRTWTRDQLHER